MSLRRCEIELLVPNWLRHYGKRFVEFSDPRWNESKRERDLCVNIERVFLLRHLTISRVSRQCPGEVYPTGNCYFSLVFIRNFRLRSPCLPLYLYRLIEY